MGIGRRELLKWGVGGTVASAGYVGYRETTGGSWLYDPATLTAAHNKYFAQIDYETLFDLQEEYGTETVEEVETPAGSSVHPSELERVTAVGSASLSGANGVPTALVSMAATGSFEAAVVEDTAAEVDSVDELDAQVEGYRLWETSLEDEFDDAVSASDSDVESELSAEELQPETAAFGTTDGAIVTGTLSAPEAEIGSLDAVETMIEANEGGVGGPDLLREDDDYDAIRGQFGSDPTFLFGAILEPATVTLAVAASQFVLGFAPGVGGAAGTVVDQWVQDLRAGAVGADVDLEEGTTTVRAFLTYNGPHTAEKTGIVQLVDAASTASGAREAVELDARYAGSSVVVEAEGETEALFEQAQQSPTDATSALLRSQGMSG